MTIVLGILTGLSMLATLGVLFAGMLGLLKDDHSGARSNRLMQWRVALQGITLVLFVLLISVMRG